MSAIRRRLGRAWIAMAVLAVIAAVISYSDGLFLVRMAGAVGRVDYLYPLLPDGLIIICLIDLYTAASAKAARPRWATTGVILGAVLTVGMNVTAGLAHSVLLAWVDGLVPVMFFVAAEVLNGHIRRGRGTHHPPGAPATLSHCGHGPATGIEDAVWQAFEHLRDCEGEEPTFVDLAARFGVDRKKVAAMVKRGQGAPVQGPPPPRALATQAPPPGPSQPPSARAAANGSGHG